MVDEEKLEFIDKFFKKLLKDRSKLVKATAFKLTAKYIAYRKGNTPIFLVKAFSKLTEAQANTDLCYSCAYYFPGVIFKLGASRWETVKFLFMKLFSM